ncbi:MAG: DUF1080 domain-containing protein [Verrucomicrobiota bacterium]
MKRVVITLFLCLGLRLYAEESPCHGRWAFTLPDGNPAWLKVASGDTGLEGALLWSVGSAKPVRDLVVEKDRLSFVRRIRWKPFGGEIRKQVVGPITGEVRDGRLTLTVKQITVGDKKPERETFRIVGKRMPPMPPRPDLRQVRFGDPVDLIGDDLTGWRLTHPKKKNGWRVEKGILINETPKTDFTAYGSYGNLRTDRTFMDFELVIEYNVEAGGNSGIYLRGAYEAQVVDRDSRMQGIQGPGAIFGRIAPSENAAKPGGQWNRYRLVLVDRHITVELNGNVVIDNQPLEGCTGGGMNADDTIPGPIFLQGDHTSVRYRNIRLRPVL